MPRTIRRTPRRRLQHANRLYRVLSRVSETIVRRNDRLLLFADVCQIAVEEGGFKLAWIGLVDERTGRVVPVGVSGEASSYPYAIKVTSRDEPAGHGPTGTAIREGRAVVCNNIADSANTRPWHHLAAHHALRASGAFPLVVYGRAIGALNLYADSRGFFDRQEVGMLEQVANVISFALEKLEEEERRSRDETNRQLDIERQEALLHLTEMTNQSEREVIEYALEEAVRLTSSSIGYLHFVLADGVNLQLFTWSNSVREACSAAANTHYPIASAGVWVDCLRTRAPVFHNDYQNLPNRHGYPEGHIHLVRHMSVPLIDGDQIVAIAGVGNKLDHYDEKDARQLLLFMSGMWAMIQRKRAESALRESEARYRRLTEHAPDIIYRYRLHPDPGFEYVSPAVTTLTGYTPDDHYADPQLGYKLIHPEDRHTLKDMAEGGVSFKPIELRWVRRDGTELWVEQRNVPVYNATGEIIAIEGIARDITDRKLAETTLRAERAQLEYWVMERTRDLRHERDRTRAMLEALSEAVIVVDPNGVIDYLNPAATTLTGLHGGISPTVWAWWRTQTADANPNAQLCAALKTGRRWQGEVTMVDASGIPYDAAITVAPLFDPDAPGHPVRFVTVHRDITATRAAERMKDQFVSNVSHELRSPTSLITMLSGNLELLYHRLDDPRRLAIIADIRAHTRTLNELIGSVLEISRIDGGRVDGERHSIDLMRLVRDEVAQFLPIARRKHLSLTVERGQALPIIAEEGQIRQVLRNLLTNALKFTPEHGQIVCTGVIVGDQLDHTWPGHVRLPPGQWVALRISDSGIGIRATDLPHIFERFYRAETQGNIPGTGLGLSIASELVRLHGGTIEVRSTLGMGSTFVIYLPLDSDEEAI